MTSRSPVFRNEFADRYTHRPPSLVSGHRQEAVITDRDGTYASVELTRPTEEWFVTAYLLGRDAEFGPFETKEIAEFNATNNISVSFGDQFRKTPKVWKKTHGWEDFNNSIPFDAVVPAVHAVMSNLRPGIRRIMTSGRDGQYRHEMVTWLSKNDCAVDVLLMRGPGDQRSDSVVKREIFERHIEPFYDVLFVIDDRPAVCETWREIGLHVIQVTDPVITPRIAGGST